MYAETTSHSRPRSSSSYRKTAVAVDIDGKEDLDIEREAADFWRDLKMRAKVDAEVAVVRAEASAGRLVWSYEALKNLIVPYQTCKEEDKQLELLHEQGHCEVAEERWKAAGGGVMTETTKTARTPTAVVAARQTQARAQSAPLLRASCVSMGPQSRTRWAMGMGTQSRAMWAATVRPQSRARVCSRRRP
jgi:hypothetical protein